MASMASMSLPGLQMKCLERGRVFRTGQLCLGSRRVQCSLLSSQFRQELFATASRERLRFTAVKARHGPNDPVSHSVFSFNILDVLAFLTRLPALLLAFIKNERKVIEQVEEQVEDTVNDIAERVEKVAGVIEKIAETVVEEAKETRELMDKIEAATESVRSDVNTATGNLKPAKSKLKRGENPSPELETAAEAASKASETTEELEQAAGELEQKKKGQSHSKFQAASMSLTRRVIPKLALAVLVVVVMNEWLLLASVFDSFMQLM